MGGTQPPPPAPAQAWPAPLQPPPWNHGLPGARHGPGIASWGCGWHLEPVRAAFEKPSESQELPQPRLTLDSRRGPARARRRHHPAAAIALTPAPSLRWPRGRAGGASAALSLPIACPGELSSLSLTRLCRGRPALPQHSQLGNGSQACRGQRAPSCRGALTVPPSPGGQEYPALGGQLGPRLARLGILGTCWLLGICQPATSRWADPGARRAWAGWVCRGEDVLSRRSSATRPARGKRGN